MITIVCIQDKKISLTVLYARGRVFVRAFFSSSHGTHIYLEPPLFDANFLLDSLSKHPDNFRMPEYVSRLVNRVVLTCTRRGFA